MPAFPGLSILLLSALLATAPAAGYFPHHSQWAFREQLQNFVSLAAASVRPGLPFRVSAAVVSGAHLSAVSATLVCSLPDRQIQMVDKWEAAAGDAEYFRLLTLNTTELLAEAAASSSSCSLSVKIRDSRGSEFSKSGDVGVDPTESLTFVQTDKGAYQPGQTVKFRVVTVDEQLKSMTGNVTVLVKDSRRNLVDRIDVVASSGVAEGEFLLSDWPNLGDWTLVAKTAQGRETQTFLVEKYTLPKFELQLQVPEFVHVKDSFLPVEVTPRYTFGRPALGVAKVNVTVDFCSRWRRSERSCQFVMTDSSLVGGNKPEVAKFNFSLIHRRMQSISNSWRRVKVNVSAEFTEKFTRVSRRISREFQMYRNHLEIHLSTGDVRFWLPGMTIPLQVQLKRPNGQPYTKPEAVLVTMQLTVREAGSFVSRTQRLLSGVVNGSVALTAEIPDKPGVEVQRVKFTAGSGRIVKHKFMEKMRRNSDGFVTARLQPAGDGSVLVKIKKSESTTGVYLAVVSRGVLVECLPVNFSENSASVPLLRDRLQLLTPKFSILVVGCRGNELLAASDEFMLTNSFDKVSVTANATQAMPQQTIRLRLRASPGSFVFVSGVDHSVNLIRSGQDISADRVEQKVKRVVDNNSPDSWLLSARTEIRRSGLTALTDFKWIEDPPIMVDMEFESVVMPLSLSTSSVKSAVRVKPKVQQRQKQKKQKKQKKQSQMRKFFPESFIWNMRAANSDGLAFIDVTMPDTVTSWDVSAFAVHKSQSLQATRRPLKLVTFKNFFIRPALPYSLVRGETLVLKVVAFNYYDQDASVNVTLAGDDSFESRAIGSSSRTLQTLTVRAGGVNVTAFRVRPLSLKPLNLTIVGVASSAAFTDEDAVQRQVLVVPEGSPQFRSTARLLNATAGESVEFVPEFPDVDAEGRRVVSGSEWAELRVVGDILGPALQNVGQLLRMPFGCGEQNMINFAPAAHVHRYLLRTGQASPATSKKALTVMKTGYQRELTFKRRDGSFSAFGNYDKAGSAWLTAFVLGSFAEASDFIAIDAETLTGKSLEWLLARQQPDGLFAEPRGSRVIHVEMQGGSGSGVGMSAFVCNSLLQVLQAGERNRRLRSSSWRRLKPQLRRQLQSGLMAIFNRYAETPSAFKDNDLAVSSLAMWRQFGPDQKVSQFMWRQLLAASSLHGDSRAWGNSVETSAYALMTSLIRGSDSVSLQAVKWLLSHQGDLGGFRSTQDTVVGLQALAQFAATFSDINGTAEVVATWPTGGVAKFSVDASSRQLLQRRPVGEGADARVSPVRVVASGTGGILASLTWRFHLSDPPAAFITDSWTRLAGFRLRLRSQFATFAEAAVAVCADAEVDGAGMHVLSVSHPTGFLLHSHTQASGIEQLQLVESDASEVVFYFTELSTEVCVSVSWKLDVPILNLQPQKISLQNYYKPEKRATMFHLHQVLTGQKECDVCPDCPLCGRDEL